MYNQLIVVDVKENQPTNQKTNQPTNQRFILVWYKYYYQFNKNRYMNKKTGYKIQV